MTGLTDLASMPLDALLECQRESYVALADVQAEIARRFGAGPQLVPVAGPPEVVPASEAARRLGVTPRWLNRATRGLRFRCDKSRKVVLYEAAGLTAWWSRKPRR